MKISQNAFDEVVKENISDFEMDPDEALKDAIETLTLQGVDLSGIVKRVPGVNSSDDVPIIQALEHLRKLSDTPKSSISFEDMNEAVNNVYELCSVEGSEDKFIATRYRAIEILLSVCSDVKEEKLLALALKALSFVITDVQNTETFRKNGGPKVIFSALNGNCQNLSVLDGGFAVIAKAAAGNEVIKESFIDLKIDELFLQIMRERNVNTPESLYDAIRVLLTPDDNRVVASQVFGYARRFAKLGLAIALVDALKAQQLKKTCLVSAFIALKSLAVNEEICRSVSENGGIDAIFFYLGESLECNNEVARNCCTLLSKLAGSDDNKLAIVQKGGLDRLIKVSSRFADDPSVLQEVMSLIGVLSLRLPDNAARAVEAGAGDLAIKSMRKFPSAYQMQRQSCLMIRNLVARNPENRTILLSNGIEELIRKAKASHPSCKDAATAALRDLGLDDYNS